MTRVFLFIAAATALAAADVDSATVTALAGTYRFQQTEGINQNCLLTLKREWALRRGDLVLRPVEFTPACRETFLSLRGVTHWAATGGASIALFGGEPLAEVSDVSPVQDGTGVYLRGGFVSESGVYELRPLNE